MKDEEESRTLIEITVNDKMFCIAPDGNIKDEIGLLDLDKDELIVIIANVMQSGFTSVDAIHVFDDTGRYISAYNKIFGTNPYIGAA